MTDPIVVVNNQNVGQTAMGFCLQALSWIAFGFFVCGGWHLMEWVLRKAT